MNLVVTEMKRALRDETPIRAMPWKSRFGSLAIECTTKSLHAVQGHSDFQRQFVASQINRRSAC